MFFEDINSIYSKYEYLSFWYEISYNEIKNNVNKYVDFIEISINQGEYVLDIHNSFWTGLVDFIGSSVGDSIEVKIGNQHVLLYSNQKIRFYIYVDKNIEQEEVSFPYFVPQNPLVFVRTNNIYDNNEKIYIDFVGGIPVEKLWVGTGNYNNQGGVDLYINQQDVYHDDDGYYVNPFFDNTYQYPFFYIGLNNNLNAGEYYFGKVINVPDLPVITYDALYKDGNQHIQLYFDGNIIDDKYYSIIYKNEVLKDNIIDINEDVNQIDIKINLNHPDYIKTVLDYSIPINYFVLTSMSDISIAKQKGIRTVVNNEYDEMESLNISDIKLISNEMIVADNLSLENATLISDHIRMNNVHLKDSKIQVETIRPDTNDFTNIECISSNINDTILLNCKIKAYGNCIYENNEFNNCLIISDSDNISILNNTFNEVFEYADYFPNTLYLTGNFNCQGNTFIQEKTFTELDFNVALLKTIPETNINNFINSNTFNLNNTVESTTYTGLFYNLIDEDDLRYKELD